MPSRPAPESPETFLAICEDILQTLPSAMRDAASRVAIMVHDFAQPDILADFGMTDPYELTGLYMGVAMIHESVTHPSPDAPMIFLYRLPIIAEWQERGDVPLDALVAHVFIHELAHHFGWSDEEIDAILDDA
ncbi:MAG: metallopeptidase family protein [Pseudomonadota bacterium]